MQILCRLLPILLVFSLAGCGTSDDGDGESRCTILRQLMGSCSKDTTSASSVAITSSTVSVTSSDDTSSTTPESSSAMAVSSDISMSSDAATSSSIASSSAASSSSAPSVVTMKGTVAVFPDSTSGTASNKASRLFQKSAGGISVFDKIRLAGDATENAVLSRADMVPAQALVSAYLLSDVDYANPVATVRTDINGSYNIRATDVRDYMVNNAAAVTGMCQTKASATTTFVFDWVIDAAISDDDINRSMKCLGKLQIRALVVKGEGEQRRALAIQSIADPSNVDEMTGEPIPAVVDPIVHRVVKTVVNQIKESINSLRNLGLADTVVSTLTQTVIDTVVPEISRVVNEAADTIIEIPQGQSINDVINAQENEFEINVPSTELDQLATVITTPEDVTENELLALGDTTRASEVISAEESTLKSSLDSESQGLLAGLEAALNENVTDSVDQAIAAAGNDLTTLFNVEDQAAADAALEAQQLERDKQLRIGLQRFFVAMGLGVVIAQNEAGSAVIVAFNLNAPIQIPSSSLPGVAGFEERNVRLFKVGAGEFSVDSVYANVPALSSIRDQLLAGVSLEAFQTSVNDAVADINDPNLASLADSGDSTAITQLKASFALIDRVRLYHKLSERLKEASIVSLAVQNDLIANRNTTIKIKRLASVIANNYVWVNQAVSLTPEGLPINSGRLTPLASGASTVNSSEILRTLSLTLEESPSSAGRALTERIGFYAQFAPKAVESALQQLRFEEESNNMVFSALDGLAQVYPETAAGYRTLIIGSSTAAAAPAYASARDRVARGLTSALPASLFGLALNSETDINIRSALFFLDFVLKNRYLIDPTQGYFTHFTLPTTEPSVRLVPNYANIKQLIASDQVSVTTLVADLLAKTPVDNGELFPSIRSSIKFGVLGLPVIPEFKAIVVDDFVAEEDKSLSVNMSCTVERYDGVDPAAGTSPLQLSVFNVIYDPDTGAYRKGSELALVNGSESAGNAPYVDSGDAVGINGRRTYTVGNLPVPEGGGDYVVRFSLSGYQNDLPELFFYVDGFVPELVLCESEHPLFIGPDQKQVPVPGLGIFSEQSRVGASGQTEIEGVDLSNFALPGAPIYVIPSEGDLGSIDFSLVESTVATAYELMASSNAGFAPLFGAYVNGVMTLSLTQSDTNKPLYGMFNVVGANVRPVIQALVDNPDALSATIALDNNPDTFEYDRLYLMRDAKGKYWIIEIHFLDEFNDAAGNFSAFVDFGFVGVDSLGQVFIPEPAFDDFGNDAPAGELGQLFYQNMLYGDWFVFEQDRPSNYSGPNLLEPEQVSFGGNGALYSALAEATDGVIIRYSANHFEDNITSIDDFITVFGDPADYSAVPVRLDAGRPGIKFVKLRLNKQSKQYVMSPSPETAGTYVGSLKHNDIVAIFSDNFENGQTPVYIGRALRHLPVGDPYANFEIAFEWVRFADIVTQQLPDGELDPREVVCFVDDLNNCPSNHPALVFSSDVSVSVGTVFDADFDGVPALFDPNDQDPNVPGDINTGANDGVGQFEGVALSILARADASGNASTSLLLETYNVYPGEIKALTLDSPIFGANAGSQVLFNCTAPKTTSSGEFVDYQCSARTVAGGVTVTLHARSGESVAFTLDVPDDVLAALGDYVDAKYTLSFHAPMDLNGDPVMCGDAACPARPNVSGTTSTRLVSNIAVVTDLQIGIGSDAPKSFASLSSLDMSRELNLTGAIVPGAVEYALTIYCEGSLPGEEFLPEEHRTFYAPAFDSTGRAVKPEFHIFEPWLGGRSCDFTFEAMLETDAGDFIGVSSLTFDDVILAGGTGGAGDFVDNELMLSIGDSACLGQDANGHPAVTMDACTAEFALFTLTDTQVAPEVEPSALLTLGAGVQEAFADGGRKEMTAGRLAVGATVSLDVNLNVAAGEDIAPPTCGIISSDAFSNFCGPQTLIESLQAVFYVNDASELIVHPDFSLPMQFASPTSEVLVDAVSLLEPGFFALVDPDNGEKIIEIGIDSFEIEPGVREIFANFTLVAGGNEFDGTGDGTFNIGAPAFMHIFHNSGQPVDFDVRYIRDGVMKVVWFMPPPRKALAGEHDINGDGAADMMLAFDSASGDWQVNFLGGVTYVEQFTFSGPVPLNAASDGTLSTVINEGDFYADFMVSFDGKQYQLYIEFHSGGSGFVEWFEIFGGPSGPGENPGDCTGCPERLIEFVFKDGMPVTLFDGGADFGYNTIAEGAALIDFEIVGNFIVITLADGASADASLNSYDPATGAPVSASIFEIPLGQGAEFIHYQGDGKSLDIEIFDTGFDVVVNIYEAFVETPPEGEHEVRDFDADGVADAFDNCVLTANADQADVDGNDVGDVCESVGFAINGLYMAEVLQNTGSMVLDEFDALCVAAEDNQMLIEIKTHGSEIFIRSLDDEPGEGLRGHIHADGTLTLLGGDTFIATDAYYDDIADTLSFNFTETYEASGGTGTQCLEDASVMIYGAAPVNEQSVFGAGGISWFDFYDGWDEFGPFLEIEYGVVQEGVAEVFYTWDFATQTWAEETGNNFEYYVTETGLVPADDRYAITGYVNSTTGEGALLRPTYNGQWVETIGEQVDLAAFDIAGLPIESLFPGLAMGSANTVFSEGAVAYTTRLTPLATQMPFECDALWGEAANADLVCHNGMVIDWSVDQAGASAPVFAASLDDAVVVRAEADQMIDWGRTVYIGEGEGSIGEYSVQARFVSDDGLASGANLVVQYILTSRNGAGFMPKFIGQTPVEIALLGTYEVMSFSYPRGVSNLIDEDRTGTFLVVESELEGTPMLRVGDVYASAKPEVALTVNSIARDDIAIGFMFEEPMPEPCDPTVDFCEPPSGCDPTVEACEPPPVCDPTVEVCEPPLECDPTIEVCEPPSECDLTVEVCDPPSACDPAIEVCEPLAECDPTVEVCEPSTECDPTVETCEPVFSGDPIEGAGRYGNECESCHGVDGVGGSSGDVVPVKTIYFVGSEEVDLVTKIIHTMPLADPSVCDITCAENIAAYLHSLSGPLP